MLSGTDSDASMRPASNRATSSASGFIREMPCAAKRGPSLQERGPCRFRRHPCHALPGRALRAGGADCVVRGDGDLAWGQALETTGTAELRDIYEGGRVEGTVQSRPLGPAEPVDYMWASVQTVRGCPKHCSFCSVWRTDGQRPRQRPSDPVIEEIVELRRQGFRFIALADDNFYPCR